MSDTLFKWVKASDELPDLKYLVREVSTKKIVNADITCIQDGNIYFNYGGIFSIEYYEWLKPVSEESQRIKDLQNIVEHYVETCKNYEAENENLKNQLREQIAGAAMNEQSLLELNRKIKENFIEWCDERITALNDTGIVQLSSTRKGKIKGYKEMKQYLQSLK